MTIMRSFGIQTSNKINYFKPTKIFENRDIKIVCESSVATDGYIKHYKPDLVVYNKKDKVMFIIEIGFTSKGWLKQVELEKLNKYMPLAQELIKMEKACVNIMPIVITWDCLTTKFFQKYCEKLNISPTTQAHIQKTAIRETYKILTSDKINGSERRFSLSLIEKTIDANEQIMSMFKETETNTNERGKRNFENQIGTDEPDETNNRN
jgi:hypothetical protein